MALLKELRVASSGMNSFIKKRFEKKASFLSEREALHLHSFAKKLSDLGVNSEESLSAYYKMRAASKSLNIPFDDYFVSKDSLDFVKNKNDALFVVMSKTMSKKGITKVAYPSSWSRDVGEQVDMNKWLKTVHMIYDAVHSGEMTKQNALDYYSNFLDIDEEQKFKFKKWFKYYSDGEHLKYSSEEIGMKKQAVYMSNLGQAASTYTHSSGGFNMPGDSFDGDNFDQVARVSKDNSEKNDAFNLWKNKLHAALRRIDKLLRSKHMDGDKYKVLAEHLLSLSHQVHCLKLASTISDVTHRAAGTLQKHGQKDEANMLIKIAQEIPPQEAPQQEVPAPNPEPQGGEAEPQNPQADPNDPNPSGGQGASEQDPNDPKSAIPSADEVEAVDLKDITPLPGARQGEYDELAGKISLDDAANKLDEVAGMLADRRIIRQLAEFDIMLDKIGIASMFPELAESQSKLIDSFSYALTRVTKMMGQLANAKSIIDSRDNLPGRDEASPDTEQPQVAEDSADQG